MDQNNTFSNANIDTIKLSMNNMFVVAHTPISLVNRSGETLYCVPDAFHHIFTPAYVCAYVDDYEKHFHSEMFPRMLLRKLGILIGIIKLDSNHFIILGPVSSQDISYQEMISSFSSSVSIDELTNMHKIYKQSAIVDSLKFANILSSIALNLNHVNILPIDILRNNFAYLPSSERVNADIVPSYDIRDFYNEKDILKKLFVRDNIFHFEVRLFSAISTGNSYELDKIWSTPYEIPLFSTISPAHSLAFFLIPIITIMSRAALYGGALTDKVLDLYDLHFDTLQKITDPNYALHIIITFSYNYCNLVREAKNMSVLPDLCSACEKYIDAHISEKITVSTLTQEFGISRKKLYSMFQAHFNMPINEYITKVRLIKAATLLESSDYSISEISSSLGFVSQSYFTKVFSAYYGCTPKKYAENRKHMALL